MNIIRPSLRILIATGSVASFLGGWAVLSHSPKPAPYVLNPKPAAASSSNSSGSTSQFVMPTLQPIPTLDANGSSTSQGQQFGSVQLQPSTGFAPMLRTGGS